MVRNYIGDQRTRYTFFLDFIMFKFGLLITCILSLKFNSIFGYPDGAPERACFFMIPRHTHPHTGRPIFSQAGGTPYNITVDRTTFNADKPLRVTISGAPFKGFLLVAAEEGLKDWPTGQFYADNNMARTMMCSARNDAITHANDRWKDSITVLWYGPSFTSADMIQFVATVVTNRTTFWTGIKSVRVTQDSTAQEAQGENGPLFGVGSAFMPGMDPWGYPTTESFGWGGGLGGRMGGMGGMGGMGSRMGGNFGNSRRNRGGGEGGSGGSGGGEGGSGGSGAEGGSGGSGSEGRSRSADWGGRGMGMSRGTGMSNRMWNPFSFLFGRRK